MDVYSIIFILVSFGMVVVPAIIDQSQKNTRKAQGPVQSIPDILETLSRQAQARQPQAEALPEEGIPAKRKSPEVKQPAAPVRLQESEPSGGKLRKKLLSDKKLLVVASEIMTPKYKEY